MINWKDRLRETSLAVGYPALLFGLCMLLALAFWWFGECLLSLAEEVTPAQPGETPITLPMELLEQADELTATLSAWTLASFVIVGFALSGAKGSGDTFGLPDKLVGIVFVVAVFFSLFFSYSTKAEILELLTYDFASIDDFSSAFRPIKSVIARQAVCVCIVGAAAIYLAARGVLVRIAAK